MLEIALRNLGSCGVELRADWTDTNLKTPLHLAAYNGDYVALWMIMQLTDRVQHALSTVDRLGMTPLLRGGWAAQCTGASGPQSELRISVLTRDVT